MLTYLQQLEAKCTEVGLDLGDVCRADGVADTTLARCRKGETNFRESTAKSLFHRIELIVAEREPATAA